MKMTRPYGQKQIKTREGIRRQSGTFCQRVHRSVCMGEMIFCVVLSVVLLILEVVGAEGQTLAAASSSTTTGVQKSDVVVIGRGNFAQTVKEGKWLVEFYTPWCSHCKKLQPTWEEVATDLKGQVNVGKINCEVETALCRRFHVRGYPTVVHVDNRKARYYEKSRSKDALCSFALEGYRSVPAVNTLKSPFGPLENIKGVVVDASFYAKYRFMEKLHQGTPIWMLLLAVIVALALGTMLVSLALVMLAGGKPKRE